VGTSFSCSEGPFGPGLTQCQDSGGVAASTGVPPTASATGRLDTASPGRHVYTVLATSGDGLTGEASLPYTVAGAPLIAISSPAPRTYRPDERVAAHFACKDGAFGPGLASCTGAVSDGGPIDTQSLGRISFTVTATSTDGQTTSKTIDYQVAVPLRPTASHEIVSIPTVHANWVFTKLVSLRTSQPRCTSTLDRPRLCLNRRRKQPAFTVRGPGNAALIQSLIALHRSARSYATRHTILLTTVAPGGARSRFLTKTVTYRLTAGWPSKIRPGTGGAGGSATGKITVTFTGRSLTRIPPGRRTLGAPAREPPAGRDGQRGRPELRSQPGGLQPANTSATGIGSPVNPSPTAVQAAAAQLTLDRLGRPPTGAGASGWSVQPIPFHVAL
jgi:hypothetical protein